jgi:hypothetical protein
MYCAQRALAADVPLRQEMQLLRPHLAKDVAEVKVGLGDALDVTAANLAAVALVAACHKAILS